MTTSVFVRLLETVASPVGQSALAAHPRVGDILRNAGVNPSLADDAWIALYGTKPERHFAAWALTEHPLTPGQLDHILAVERRTTVLDRVLARCDLTAEQGRVLLAHGVKEATATIWVQSGLVPAELTDQVHTAFRREYDTVWKLRNRHLFDQDAMLDAITDLKVARGEDAGFLARRALALLLHPNAGPDVISAAISAYDAATAINSGILGQHNVRRLRSPEARGRLADLRYAITRPWEECDTPDELQLLRALRGGMQVPHATAARLRASGHEARLPQMGGATRREWEYSSNSFARIEDAGGQAVEATQPDADRTIAVSRVPVNDASVCEGTASAGARRLEELLDQAGPETWAVAVTLLADGYEGTVADLVATARLFAPASPSIRVTVATRSVHAPDGPERV
jgi:hypothetical protein